MTPSPLGFGDQASTNQYESLTMIPGKAVTAELPPVSTNCSPRCSSKDTSRVSQICSQTVTFKQEKNAYSVRTCPGSTYSISFLYPKLVGNTIGGNQPRAVTTIQHGTYHRLL